MPRPRVRLAGARPTAAPAKAELDPEPWTWTGRRRPSANPLLPACVPSNEQPVPILIVDDQEENLCALEAVLDGQGYYLVKANSGEETLRQVLKTDFALVLLDAVMPTMDGFEVAELMRGHPRSRQMPIVFLTARELSHAHLEKAYASGAVDLIYKPFIPAVLRSKVEVFAELYRNRRTVQLQADNLVQESESRYRDLFENTSDLIQAVAPDGRFLYVNAAWKKALGYADAEVGDLRLANILHPDGRAETVAVFRRLLRGENVGRVEAAFVTKAGTRLLVEGSNSTRFRDGRCVSVRGIFRDITDRKHTEAAIKASLAEKETLLKEIHHRVKNNMQIICSMLSLQSEYVVDATARRLFEECQSRVRSMALVHEKLYRAPNLSTIDFGEHVRDVAAVLAHSCEGAIPGVQIDLETDSLPLDIELAVPLGLIIHELVSNSLKHAFPARRPGKVRVLFHLADAGAITLAVQDDGVGLPADFDLERPRSLGLQIVRNLVRQMDGRLEVHSGNGTTFRVTCPLPRPPRRPRGKRPIANSR